MRNPTDTPGRRKVSDSADLGRVFDKPGREWSRFERDACVLWLFSTRLDRLLLFAMHCLGEKSDHHDARDAWMSFCVESLDRTVDTYDPERGRHFPNYLYLCLQRHCARLRKKRRIRDAHEREARVDQTSRCEFRLEIANGFPGNDLHDRVERRDLMQKALNRLPTDLAFVLIDHHLKGHAIAAIARRANLPVGTVKMRLHRARMRMKREIRKLEAPPRSGDRSEEGAES